MLKSVCKQVIDRKPLATTYEQVASQSTCLGITKASIMFFLAQRLHLADSLCGFWIDWHDPFSFHLASRQVQSRMAFWVGIKKGERQSCNFISPCSTPSGYENSSSLVETRTYTNS